MRETTTGKGWVAVDDGCCSYVEPVGEHVCCGICGAACHVSEALAWRCVARLLSREARDLRGAARNARDEAKRCAERAADRKAIAERLEKLTADRAARACHCSGQETGAEHAPHCPARVEPESATEAAEREAVALTVDPTAFARGLEARGVSPVNAPGFLESEREVAARRIKSLKRHERNTRDAYEAAANKSQLARRAYNDALEKSASTDGPVSFGELLAALEKDYNDTSKARCDADAANTVARCDLDAALAAMPIVEAPAGGFSGGYRNDCPHCNTHNAILDDGHLTYAPANTERRRIVRCRDCGRTWRMPAVSK